jgi:hypothetical protein
LKIELTEKRKEAVSTIYKWWRRLKETTLHWRKQRPVDQINIV